MACSKRGRRLRCSDTLTGTHNWTEEGTRVRLATLKPAARRFLCLPSQPSHVAFRTICTHFHPWRSASGEERGATKICTRAHVFQVPEPRCTTRALTQRRIYSLQARSVPHECRFDAFPVSTTHCHYFWGGCFCLWTSMHVLRD